MPMPSGWKSLTVGLKEPDYFRFKEVCKALGLSINGVLKSFVMAFIEEYDRGLKKDGSEPS